MSPILHFRGLPRVLCEEERFYIFHYVKTKKVYLIPTCHFDTFMPITLQDQLNLNLIVEERMCRYESHCCQSVHIGYNANGLDYTIRASVATMPWYDTMIPVAEKLVSRYDSHCYRSVHIEFTIQMY